MRYKSCAKWPEGTFPNSNDVTREPEWSKGAAENVCITLERDGLAGEGEVFPVRTWTEEEKF